MNEKNTIVTIAVVAIVVLATFCGVAVVKYKNDDGYKAKVTGNVPVYGNANNDDYIDSHDVDTLKDIIKDGTWDKTAYPYADANNDGFVRDEDVEIVEKIIAGESTDVYYVNVFSDIAKVQYPIKHERIGVSYWQQAELAAILGDWDKVVLASQSTTSSNSHRYDTSNIVKSFKGSNITSELILECQCDFVIASQGKSAVVQAAIDAAKTDSGKEITPFYVDVSKSATYVGIVLTLGVLLNENAKAQEYADFVNGLVDKIDKGMEKVNKKATAAITLMYANQSTRTNIVIECKGTGAADTISLIADVYDSSSKSTGNNRIEVEKDFFIQNSGRAFDFIIIEQEGTDTKKVNDTYYTPQMYNERFEEAITYYANTASYEQGKILGTTYSYNSFSGFANLMYLAYLLYPNIFNAEDGWNALQEYFDKFTTAKIDVRTQGGWFYTGNAYPQYTQRLA